MSTKLHALKHQDQSRTRTSTTRRDNSAGSIFNSQGSEATSTSCRWPGKMDRLETWKLQGCLLQNSESHARAYDQASSRTSNEFASYDHPYRSIFLLGPILHLWTLTQPDARRVLLARLPRKSVACADDSAIHRWRNIVIHSICPDARHACSYLGKKECRQDEFANIQPPCPPLSQRFALHLLLCTSAALSPLALDNFYQMKAKLEEA